jgi:hypothetical protein
MEELGVLNDRPDVPAEERRWDELIKRVRKLRWIGMEQEAEQVWAAWIECKHTGGLDVPRQLCEPRPRR